MATPIKPKPKLIPLRPIPKPDARSARQRFSEDLDFDDATEGFDEDERECRRVVTPVRPTPKPALVPVKATPKPVIVPKQSTKAVDEDEDEEVDSNQSPEPEEAAAPDEFEEDAGNEPVRSSSLAEFTQIVGRVPEAVSATQFIPTSGEITLIPQPAESIERAVSISVPAEHTSPVARRSDSELRAKAQQLMHDGLSDAAISVRLGMTIDTVIDIRREFAKLSKVSNPRDIFRRKIEDLDEAFETAKSNFFDDPTSEINFRAMTEFTRALRETIEAYNDLEDPATKAGDIVKRIIQPLLIAMMNTAVATMGRYKDDVVSFVPDHVKKIAEAGLVSHTKNMQTAITTSYNKAVATLEVVCNVDLSQFRLSDALKPDEGDANG